MGRKRLPKGKGTCLNKIKYKTKIEAEQKLKIIKRGPNFETAGVTIYKCKFCNQWHIGHLRKDK